MSRSKIGALSIVLISVLCNSCSYAREKYPADWPKILVTEEYKCPNITGVYKNFAPDLPPSMVDTVSLAQVFINPESANGYIREVDRVAISQSESNIDITAYDGNRYVADRRLMFGTDILCQKGKVSFPDKSFFIDKQMFGVFGYDAKLYDLTLSEDGSLIMYRRYYGGGWVILIPAIVNRHEYFRFLKVDRSTLDANGTPAQ